MLGPVANMTDVLAEDVLAAARAFVATILQNYRQRSGKARVLLKTPDDMGHLTFLLGLFPNAHFVHLYRDGRDVACSTVAQKGKLLGQHLPPYGEINLHNALRRWRDWEENARRAIAGGAIAKSISCRYEDLVADPEPILRNICRFIDVPYSPTMLEFSEQQHDLPQWEAGSQDVRERPTISPASVHGKWKSQIPREQFPAVDAALSATRWKRMGIAAAAKKMRRTRARRPARRSPAACPKAPRFGAGIRPAARPLV